MSVGAVNKQTGDRIPTAGMPAIDSVLSGTSTNPVQNAIITAALGDKQDSTDNSLQTADKTIVGAINEVNSNLSGKQNATDNNLTTTSKTVVGGINELKSGLTNLDNEVNGDATVYPYADVITVEDAVPANLADCSVKIEPVQDLHGYDHPWVGGAERNKCESFVATSATEQYVVALYIETELQASTQYAISFDDIANNKYYANENVFTRVVAITTVNGRNSIIVTTRDNLAKSSATYEDGKGWICLKNQFAQAQTPDIDRVQIETGSSATDYAPYSNICPITGHTEASVQREGVNLFDPDHYETFDLTGEGVTLRYGHQYGANTYTIINNGSNMWYYRVPTKDLSDRGTTQNIAAGSSATVTVDSSHILWVFCQNWATDSPDDICVRIGNATPYEPYKGQQYTLALGDTYYKGLLDVDTGVFTSYNVKRLLNDPDKWISTSGNIVYKYNEEFTDRKQYTSDSYAGVFTSFIVIDQTSQYTGRWQASDSNYFGVRDDNSLITLEQLKTRASAGDLSICYELATPLTVQLTPEQIQLLQGTNTLYASTGDISVTVNGVRGAIGSVQTQANATDNALAQLAADIAEQLPDAPTTDGAYVLTVTVADGAATYSWESAE